MSTTSKTINNELSVKCTIWEKETFELIDYYNNDVIRTKFKINSPGVLSRTNKQISFIPGEDLDKSPSDLITIRKNKIDGKFIIDSGNWSKELDKLVDEQGAFIVYRGLSFKELNNNLSSRYYKLSQGDIIKIGRIYFKVLDIHTKKDNVEVKSNVDAAKLQKRYENHKLICIFTFRIVLLHYGTKLYLDSIFCYSLRRGIDTTCVFRRLRCLSRYDGLDLRIVENGF